MTKPESNSSQPNDPASQASPAAPGHGTPANAGSVSSSTPPTSPAADAAANTGTNPGADRFGGSVVDRRLGLDRRQIQAHLDGDDSSGLERRRGRGRRLSDFTKSAEEGEMTKEQFLFLMAIDQFKKGNAMSFPTWTDVLEVIRLLGYRKTMPSELSLRNADDWRERHDAPANVRPQRWAQRAEIDRQRNQGRADAA
jgi:hypothetical protein